jgi:hypothetical protein
VVQLLGSFRSRDAEAERKRKARTHCKVDLVYLDGREASMVSRQLVQSYGKNGEAEQTLIVRRS